ncbi:MAG: 3-deoxy-8-phosphooctulonate synthase, partial [Bacteroidota bacterium]
MTKKSDVLGRIPFIQHLSSGNFFLLAGPCVVEGNEITFDTARIIKQITDDLKIPFIFKSSYKKANRSKADSFTGIGDNEAID